MRVWQVHATGSYAFVMHIVAAHSKTQALFLAKADSYASDMRDDSYDAEEMPNTFYYGEWPCILATSGFVE